MILAHLADVHFGREDRLATELAREVILAANVDAVVVAGDLTQRGKRSEFEAAREYLESFGRPVLSVPGNHDTPLLDMSARARDPFGRYDRFLGEFSAPIESERLMVRGLNTARGWQARSNWAEGSVNLADLEAAIGNDAQAGGAVRMLACHHPFRAPSRTPLRVDTRRGSRASQRLGASGVSVLLTGHIHSPYAERIEEPGGAYVAISAGTLSSRLRSSPASFNLIKVVQDRVSLEVLQLSGGVFTPAGSQSWELPGLAPVQAS
ncbi:metallophosphoesterase family protein [Hyphomonas sp.]|uniref:metallophosphoesterase family protein n=1 Tax=Hyphomonas sp. TaxID=87 RepID=UPI00391A9D1E